MTGQNVAVVETICCRAVLELRLVAPGWAEMGSGGEGSTWRGGQGQSASQCPQGPDTPAGFNLLLIGALSCKQLSKQ